MRWRIGVLVAVVGIAVMMLTFGIPTAAARGTSSPTTASPANHTIVVLPNGHDDTADIQAAFNACVSYGPGCTVQLVKGTYYTEQIAVYGFEGSFVGAGQGRTVIQGLPNLPSPNPIYDTATVQFWAGMPTGATGSNPWPDLFTFVGGTFSVSGMTITDTSPNPSAGWMIFGITFTGLWAMIEVTGLSGQQVAASVNGVTFIGGAGDIAGFDSSSMLFFQGALLPPGWTSETGDQIPISGSFSVTNSVFYNVSSAVGWENVLDATGSACFNTVINTIVQSPPPYSVFSEPFFFVDLSNSQLQICGNYVTNVPGGIVVTGSQSLYKFPLLPSTVYVTGNDFNDVNTGADGVYLSDYGPSEGLASTLSAVVSGNFIQTDTSCGCYGTPPDVIPAIQTTSLVSAVVDNNLLVGGAGVAVVAGPGMVSGNIVRGNIVGVELYSATGVSVTGNVITNSAWYGIALFEYSSNNLIAHNVVKNSGLYDLYWDGTGTGNVWTHNICSTSSPPGLC